MITTHFTADDLENFSVRLARINFKIRFPAGIEDIARQRAEGGPYISRRALGMFSGSRIADDWISEPQRNAKDQE